MDLITFPKLFTSTIFKMIKLCGYVRMMDHKNLNPVLYNWVYAEYQDATNTQIERRSSNSLNEWIGKKIRLSTNDEIRCMECSKKTKKSFNQGYCFVCFSRLAKNDLCIMKPETCHHHKGTCREPIWGEEHCFKKHTVYFANSSGIKVGITKENPISNRWVDQGASFGIGVLEVGSRRDAGIIESYLSKFLPDKTSWQKMVSADPIPLDLKKEKDKFVRHLETQNFVYEENPKGSVQWTILQNAEPISIHYPITRYPSKIKSLKLTNESPIHDTLVGIKGQYLLFDSGVINIRSLGGLYCELSID